VSTYDPLAEEAMRAPVRRLSRAAVPALEENPVTARIAVAGVAIAVAAVVGQTAIHLFNAWALDYRWGFFDVASDEDLFAWASVSATAAAALAALLIAVTARPPAIKLLALAALVAFLSLDDLAKLHELIGGWISGILDLWDKADRLVWPVLFLPLLTGVLALLLDVSAQGPAHARRLVRIGIGLLALAVVLEVGSQGLYKIGFDDPDLPLVLELVAEEGAELGGWILISTGLLMIATARQWRLATRGEPVP
jgi:hypothetical protein